MVNLEIYPVGSERDDFLAFVSMASHVPQQGSYLMLRTLVGQGYAKYKVVTVENWFDTAQHPPESVNTVVLEVEACS